ncbi:MAG: DUF1684 domain-containing protein [Nitriliruptorales bacterium]|nr:DUF1684 domain-containing protein [Nitriliruptorales bacterium]
MKPRDALDLLDYRRRVADLYHHVRASGADRAAWDRWREERDQLFATHPQSPFGDESRQSFEGLDYFAYDPAFRVTAALERRDEQTFQIAHSSDGSTTARRIGALRFDLSGTECHLSVFWLEQYGGGLFLPFRDATCGEGTYGGGRYLLDTAKSADLGATEDGALILDFNFAYHPSCFHDPRWSCPLAPPENALAVAVTAGEREAPE